MSKSTLADTAGTQDQRFVKALGPVMLTAAVVNVIVGGGIFRLPAQLSDSLGAASPTAFLLGAMLMLVYLGQWEQRRQNACPQKFCRR